MSRGQSTQAFQTASSQNATNYGNAQSSFGNAQNDINSYQNQLAQFVANNPYTPGGQYDQTINPQLANVSDAGSNSLKGALQSQALRTGQNSAADAATAASTAQQNTRNLSSSLASAQQQRIQGEAGYNQEALQASAVPAQMESSLYGSAGSQANSALNTETDAAKTPSFWDEVGAGLAGGLGSALGGTGYNTGTGNWNIGGGGGGKGCWIAAELYGGWYEPRTILVRNWLHTEFSETLPGRTVVAIYMRLGERIARFIHKYPALKFVFLPLFNAALARAQKWDQSFPGDNLLSHSRQEQARLKKHQEFERELQEETDTLLRAKIGSYLQRLGYAADDLLVKTIALRLLQKFNGNALLVSRMDELRCLPQGEDSHRRRLSAIDQAIQEFLPIGAHNVLVAEETAYARAK